MDDFEDPGAALRIVSHMRRGAVRAEPLAGVGRLALIREDGESLAVDAQAFRALARQGLISKTGRDGLARLTAEAGPWFKSRSAAARNKDKKMGARRAGEGTAAAINPAESPVALLTRLRCRDGKPWLGAAESEAAERLRRDFELACLQPSVTMNWRFGEATGGSLGAHGGKAELSDMALAARTRVHQALEAVGPELSGFLLDVCCFLKGLEHVERERQWPARSAKLMLRTALAILARHYGTTGGTGGGAARSWGVGDFRPAASDWGSSQAMEADAAS